jgi:hypothetical protein
MMQKIFKFSEIDNLTKLHDLPHGVKFDMEIFKIRYLGIEVKDMKRNDLNWIKRVRY